MQASFAPFAHSFLSFSVVCVRAGRRAATVLQAKSAADALDAAHAWADSAFQPEHDAACFLTVRPLARQAEQRQGVAA